MDLQEVIRPNHQNDPVTELWGFADIAGQLSHCEATLAHPLTSSSVTCERKTYDKCAMVWLVACVYLE